METKYSKTEFEGFTHRFIIKFETGEPYSSNLTLYSNSDSYQELEDFVNTKKTAKVISFSIVHRASKEQDEITSQFLDETLNDI